MAAHGTPPPGGRAQHGQPAAQAQPAQPAAQASVPQPPPSPPPQPRIVLGVKHDGGTPVPGHPEQTKYILTVFVVKITGEAKEGIKNVKATWICEGRKGVIDTPNSDYETATFEYTVEGYDREVRMTVAIANGEDYSIDLFGPKRPHDREPQPPNTSGPWEMFWTAVKGAFHG